MSQTTLSYTITVTAEQARAEVERLQKEFDQSQSAAKALDLQIAKLEKDFVDLTAAVKAGGANVEAYKARLASTTAELNRMRGSASMAASAIHAVRAPTANVGMAFLDLSRAVEDAQYGLRGIQNNIPGIVASLGGSAGLTAAISLGAIAATQLYEKFTAVPEATKKAAEDAKEHIASVTKEIQDLEVELRTLQVGSERAQMEIQARAVERAASDPRIAAAGGAQRIARLRGVAGLPLGTKEAIDAGASAMDELDRQISKLAAMKRVADEKESQRLIDQAVDRANAEEEVYGNHLKKMADAAKDTFDGDDALYEAGKRALGILTDAEIDREVAKQEKMLAENSEELAQAGLKAIEDREQEKAKWEAKFREDAQKEVDKAHRAAEQEQERHARAMADITVDAFSMVGDAIAAAASGQEDAWANLLVSAAKYAGDLITLKGGEALGTGIAAVSTGNPAGAASIASGLGLIAAGQAIAVGGAAAVGALTGQAGGSANAARDRGAAPSRAAPGGSGGLTVNVSYGVAGPLPEDTARAIARAVSTGDRRRGAR